MNRRTLFATGASACTGLLAGCLADNGDSEDQDANDDTDMDDDTAGFDPTTVDCPPSIRLPDPPEPESEDAVEPFEYPAPPATLSSEDVFEYVEEVEQAYVGNQRIQNHGESIVHFNLGGDVETVSSGDDWILVRLEYQYSERVDSRDDREPYVHDSGAFVALYAVSQDWVRRTVAQGRDAEPRDPRENGGFISCSE